MTDLLDHARLYLALGFAVLPVHAAVERGGRLRCSCGRDDCAHPAKHPVGRLVHNGWKGASRGAPAVERWFADGRRLNLGIVTGAASGIIALDVDPRHGGDETLAALERDHGELPPTWRFLTGGGGEHILFRHPGRNVANSAGKIGPGIDVKGDGGYIVAPPSVHISGRPYAISVDHHPDDGPLADLPAWLLKRIASAPTGVRSPTDWRSVTKNGAEDGARNVTIAGLCGLLLGRRIDPHVCLDLLLAFNATRCRPPLSEDEVVSIVASIARREYAGRAARRDGEPNRG
jgi:hypothetical protein